MCFYFFIDFWDVKNSDTSNIRHLHLYLRKRFYLRKRYFYFCEKPCLEIALIKRGIFILIKNRRYRWRVFKIHIVYAICIFYIYFWNSSNEYFSFQESSFHSVYFLNSRFIFSFTNVFLPISQITMIMNTPGEWNAVCNDRLLS